MILVPNSILFEQNITNYTYSKDEYILDQVGFIITFESDLDEAIRVALENVKKKTREIIKATNNEPYVRTQFHSTGIDVKVRYFAPAKRLQEFSSEITQDIFKKLKHAKNVELAYPHTKVILKRVK